MRRERGDRFASACGEQGRPGPARPPPLDPPPGKRSRAGGWCSLDKQLRAAQPARRLQRLCWPALGGVCLPQGTGQPTVGLGQTLLLEHPGEHRGGTAMASTVDSRALRAGRHRSGPPRQELGVGRHALRVELKLLRSDEPWVGPPRQGPGCRPPPAPTRPPQPPGTRAAAALSSVGSQPASPGPCGTAAPAARLLACPLGGPHPVRRVTEPSEPRGHRLSPSSAPGPSKGETHPGSWTQNCALTPWWPRPRAPQDQKCHLPGAT